MTTARIQFEDVLGSSTTDKRVEVLRSVHQVGSISQAARANGVSYKAAWQALETLGNLSGVPLIEKAVGGSGGGGARLTPEGLQVLRAADALHSARVQALAAIRGDNSTGTLPLQAIAGVGLRTSMRNQLPCTVTAIRRAQGAVWVSLGLSDGQTLHAKITAESEQLLGLAKGMAVLAMCKAAAVTVAPTIVAMGGINLLRGCISRSGRSKEDQQVGVELCKGLQLAGFAVQGHVLKNKQAVMAAIDESAVVIALLG
ncbi:MAG: TOBE domain-containing protein [Burkholderiaceae bacterium]|nr:TOBE domain-containing protein [Burkholderiaceae bacterium]